MININFGEVFKSLGSFIAKNWQTLGLILMIVLFFATKNDYAALKESMEVMSQSYQEQLSLLQELHEEELARRDEAIASYETLIEEIEEQHRLDLEQIARAKEKEIQENIRDFDEQPEELLEKIEDLFGFEYVE